MLSVGHSEQKPPSILSAAHGYWNEQRSQHGIVRGTRDLIGAVWEFARDSTPSRLRSRFGDADYDWDYRVNTTSGAVGWRDRLLGTFYSLYQPTEPAQFREMIETLQQKRNLNLEEFTFVDLGSGKGRTLLMASEYPFRRIVGVELLPSLHQIAQENLSRYKSDSQRCFVLESVCGDATSFALPAEPLLLYLFNPFQGSGIRRTVENLRNSLKHHPRPAYVLYHNPQLEHILAEETFLTKIAGTYQYSLFAAVH
jgi:SAM-dependent methyltransferase